MTASGNSTVVALDVGAVRIGVAKAFVDTKLPQPHATLNVSKNVYATVARMCADLLAQAIVVGLPRTLDGNESQQTHAVRDFAAALEKATSLPIYFQDEAGTSKQAKQELQAYKDRTKKLPDHISVDSLAATYILEDFLKEGWPL